MDRISLLLGDATHATRILEIGPSYIPVAPKSGGWNTFVVDHASREELRSKYKGDKVADEHLGSIEEVDAIWRGGRLEDALPPPLHGSFDLLIASHVVEHIPDLVGFLKSIQSLLRPSGLVALAIPDRRFCFDYFKPHTMTGDVLEAYFLRRQRHTLRTIWDQAAYSVIHKGAVAWTQEPVDRLEFADQFSVAQEKYRSFGDDSSVPYSDCHAWHFTASGFALMILELAQLEIIDWHVDSTHGPDGNEFFVFLRRGREPIYDAAALQRQRLCLLRSQLGELKEQLGYAAGLLPDTPKAAAVPAQPSRENELLTQLAATVRDQGASLRELQASAAGIADIYRLSTALADAQQTMATQHREVVALGARLEAQTAELARTRDDLAVRKADLQFAQARVAELAALSEYWRQAHDLVLSSRSWRLSAPLRLAGRLFRVAGGHQPARPTAAE